MTESSVIREVFELLNTDEVDRVIADMILASYVQDTCHFCPVKAILEVASGLGWVEWLGWVHVMANASLRKGWSRPL